MPWKSETPMDQKLKFITGCLSNDFNMTELCKSHGISRKTGYKTLSRYEAEGIDGLKERSRAHHSHPHATDEAVKQILIEQRIKTGWGPKKIRAVLSNKEEYSHIHFPAPSTIGEILDKAGLIKKRKRRRKKPLSVQKPSFESQAPNDIWCADFKGEFRMGDGQYCYPLTVTDHFSRYILECLALPSTSIPPVFESFRRLFQEFGMPAMILTDNGIPFASNGIAGVSRLSAWWMKLGIYPVTIQKGRPDQNGRHERMHRTLKESTALPPADDMTEQQQWFDEFRPEFNELRPHEALNFDTPASWHENSQREYPEVEPEVEYPGYYEVRKVCSSGKIKLKNQSIFIGSAFEREILGLYEWKDGIWSVCFGVFLLGRYDEREGRITGLQRPILDPRREETQQEEEEK